MTYPEGFLKLVASGPLFTNESWSFSLSMVPDEAEANYLAPSTVPTGVVTAVNTLLTACSVSGVATLGSIKLNLLDNEGHYVLDDTVEHVIDPPSANSRTATSILPQQALVVTLTTDAMRGLANTGRFYLPVPALSLQTDGRISTANAQTVANAAAAFVNSLNSTVQGYRVGVASKVGAGMFRDVTGVRVGRVLDTVRSRRTSLDEGYVTASTAITA